MQALQKFKKKAEVTIRIVNKNEIAKLNEAYRNKNYPTNVLSFPLEVKQNIPMKFPLLGDIVVCANVVSEEAKQQGKPIKSHWAHMIVHGTLHLLGFDHEIDEDAEKMETLEIAILQQLKIANPYTWSEKI
jgi:probable rRNA maturation factor